MARERLVLVCHHAGSQSWLRAILTTERGWRRAYEGKRDGPLVYFDATLLDDGPSNRDPLDEPAAG